MINTILRGANLFCPNSVRINFTIYLIIKIDDQGTLETHVIDSDSSEEYVLHLQANATGKFVQQVADEYWQVLNQIKKECYVNETFQESQAKRMIDYLKKNYGDELEFLWKKFPENAVVRRSDTNKWYGAFLKVNKQKLNLDSDEIVTVLDLRTNPEQIQTIVDNKNYFPGYHMNKNHWFTIILDRGISDDEIKKFIQTSYDLAKK